MFWRTSLALAVAAGLSISSAQAAEKTEVFATLKPIHSLLANLMKGAGEPKLLIKEKTPLEYKPSAQDLEAVKNADLVVWMGPELEASLAPALKDKANAFEMLSYEDFKILPQRNDMERRDPHIWLDVRNAEVMVDILYEKLVSVDADNTKTYALNRKLLKRDIAKLDRRFEFGFRAVAAGQSWLYHDTQQYFEQSYAFKVRDILAPRAGAEADTANMLQMRAKLNALGKVCFFVEEGLTQKNLSFALDGTGAKVSTLKSFGLSFKPGPALYKEMMTYNFNTIADCFADIGAQYIPPASRKRPE